MEEVLENQTVIPEVIVVSGSNADWEKFRTIRLESLTEYPSAFKASLEKEVGLSDEAWQSRLVDPKTIYVFLKKNGRYIGIAGAIEIEVDKWKLTGVYLNKEFHGKGLAQMLIQAIEKNVKDLGVSLLDLMVNISQERAIGLYKKLGWAIIREEKDQLMGNGEKHTEFYMSKSLR